MIAYDEGGVTVHAGDCIEILRADENGYDFELGYGTRRLFPDASVDAVCCDPPYGLEFMGKEWDAPWKASSVGRGVRVEAERSAEMTEKGKGHSTAGGPYLAARVDSVRVAGLPFQQWCEQWATECLRVLKPGGHMLAFGGTRTWHRLACAVEDAGFEVRDSIAWLYGSGFPKSLDVSKAIDKAAGATREVVGHERSVWHPTGNGDVLEVARTGDTRPVGDDGYQLKAITAPATDDARTWQGWGTAMKPSHEPVVVARKPIDGIIRETCYHNEDSDDMIANCPTCGGKGYTERKAGPRTVAANVLRHGTGALNIDACRIGDEPMTTIVGKDGFGQSFRDDGWTPEGRLTTRQNAAAGRWPANVILDPHTAAELDAQSGELTSGNLNAGHKRGEGVSSYSGGGGIIERDYGGDSGGASRFFYTAKAGSDERVRLNGTAHPTVKPLSLMRWLVRLVTPPGGTVLEPFAGSGTTVEACILEGFRCVAIEREGDYLPLIVQRINRRRNPVEAVKATGDDMGLLGLLEGEASA